MSILTSDGPESITSPIGTNPSLFSSAGYENPWFPIEANNNTVLLSRTQQKYLGEHYLAHLNNRTFDDPADLIVHQELMAQRLIKGDSFLQSHTFALKNGPTPDR